MIIIFVDRPSCSEKVCVLMSDPGHLQYNVKISTFVLITVRWSRNWLAWQSRPILNHILVWVLKSFFKLNWTNYDWFPDVLGCSHDVWWVWWVFWVTWVWWVLWVCLVGLVGLLWKANLSYFWVFSGYDIGSKSIYKWKHCYQLFFNSMWARGSLILIFYSGEDMRVCHILILK